MPFDCPLRTEDEFLVESEFQHLSEYEVSRISGEVRVERNYTPCYVYANNHKVEENECIISHLRQNKCTIIFKSANLWYKPWTIFGFWANSGGGFDFQLKPEKKEDEFLTDSLADEAPAQQFPLNITGIRWKHTDPTRHKESPDSVVEADRIQLEAQFENYVEGAGVDFFVYGNVNGSKKQLAKVHTRCKNMAAAAEWVIDIFRCDIDDSGLEFECETRDKKSHRSTINVNQKAAFYSSY